MIFDSIDVHALVSIHKNKEIRIKDIVRTCKWEDKPERMDKKEEKEFYDAKAVLIANRLKAMAKVGLVKIEKNSRNNVYILPHKKVLKRKYRFPDGFREVLMLKLNFNDRSRWFVIEI
ncbi:MAG: hypothetical protein AABY22_35780 [Nanoarchaeota archaeon]